MKGIYQLKLSPKLLDLVEMSIRLRIDDVKTLCNRYDLDYQTVKQSMIDRFGDASIYSKVSRGKSGAINKAKKSDFQTIYDTSKYSLDDDIHSCLKMNYSVAELALIRKVNYENLLIVVKEVIDSVNYISYDDEPNKLVVDSLSLAEIRRHPTIEYWSDKYCLTEHDIHLNFKNLLTPLEYVTLCNNIFADRNYSQKKLESIVTAKAKRNDSYNEMDSLSETKLSADYSKPNSFTKEHLIADCFSVEEICQMLGISSKEVGSVSRIHSKKRQLEICELHFKRVKSEYDLSELSEMIRDGNLSLDDFCKVCYIPVRFKKYISKSGLIDGAVISKGNSSNAARSNRSTCSNLSALEEVLRNDLMLKVIEHDFSADDNRSKQLSDISKIRNYNVSNRKFEEYLIRYKSIKGSVDEYPNSEILDTLKLSISLQDVLKMRDKDLLNVDESFLKSSSNERTVETILKDLGVRYVKNCRTILNDNRELDFFIADKSIAIEVNPIATHHSNETYKHFSAKPNDYHYSKYLECKQSNIELIQLYDFDLKDVEYLKKFLSLKLRNDLVRKIFARKTAIKEIQTSTARQFLEKYHRDGYRGATTKLGLYYDDELVSVMTFAKSQNSIAQFEIARYATIDNTIVVGGLSKFVSRFKQLSDCKSLMTFSDNDKGSGRGYLKSGFEYVKETGSRLIYLSNSDPANDKYSSRIAYGYSLHNSKALVVADSEAKFIKLNDYSEIEPYIETKLSHRTDGGEGYDRLFTSGSKLWVKHFKEE